MPMTTGQLKTKVSEMEIGDYIISSFNKNNDNAIGISLDSKMISFLGDLSKYESTPIPITGSDGSTWGGYFFYVKVARGLLVADRVVRNSIPWDAINASKGIQGNPVNTGNIIPTMTSNTSPSGVASASSENSDNWGAWRLFDNTNSCYMSNLSINVNITPVTVQYDFGENKGKIVKAYSITVPTSGIASSDMSMKSWTFEASNDGLNWTVLDKKIGTTFPGSGAKVTYSIYNTNQYRYYRIKATESFGNGRICINELSMFDTVGTIRSLTGGVAYADANGNMSLIQPSPSKGNFPKNNEWDKYILSSDLDGKIVPGDDNVWHHNAVYTWTQDTPSNGTVTANSGHSGTLSSTTRTARGNTSGGVQAAFKDWNPAPSSTTGVAFGFRPVFEYQES